MSNVTINSLPTASTIDATNDLLPIYTNSLVATQAISRNTYLNVSSQPVGLTDSQTLTNKTLTSPTINGATLSGTLSGTYTIGGTPTFPSSVTQNTVVQTLTNKTLTSPTITSPTITNATISADTLTGYTVSNTGTIYGVPVTTGTISGTYLTSATVTSTQIATNGISAANLATSAITLGYTQTTTTFSSASVPVVQVTGLTVTVTIPAGGRKIKITVFGRDANCSVQAYVTFSIWDGTVSSGTQLATTQCFINASGSTQPVMGSAIVTPSAGSKTYNVGMSTSAGTATLEQGPLYPAYILVEAI